MIYLLYCLYKFIRSLGLNLDSTDKAINEEEQRVKELTTNIKTLIEKIDIISSKTKQIETNIEKINVDTQSDELIQ